RIGNLQSMHLPQFVIASIALDTADVMDIRQHILATTEGERPGIGAFEPYNFTDVNRMIPAGVGRYLSAFQVGRAIRQYRRAGNARYGFNARKFIRPSLSKPLGNIYLMMTKDINDEVLAVTECLEAASV